MTLMSCQSGYFPDRGCQFVSLSSFMRKLVAEVLGEKCATLNQTCQTINLYLNW